MDCIVALKLLSVAAGVHDDMPDENPFRLTLLAVFVIQTAASFSCFRKAKAASTIFQRRAEGISLSILLVLFYSGYSFGVVAYLVRPTWMAWSGLPIPALARWLGTGPLLFGAALAISGLVNLGTNFAIAVVPKEGNTLVTTGVYGWVRHPLYSALLVQAVGVSLLTANWFVATTAGTLWALLAFRTRQEEEKLIERFGNEYREYMKRVGRFVPRLTR